MIRRSRPGSAPRKIVAADRTCNESRGLERPQKWFAMDSLLEGDGFELFVPPHESARFPKARRVSRVALASTGTNDFGGLRRCRYLASRVCSVVSVGPVHGDYAFLRGWAVTIAVIGTSCFCRPPQK